ncbi:hypothetical protein [Microbulbifer sp. Q7]|uniref:hypothetical protein n=1 Tax=Microbulbifer sp. Q7 TaxID=1785091 RepID=UPI0012902996|nr:hypothetical protein [Microbulbifer sp. Q7]
MKKQFIKFLLMFSCSLSASGVEKMDWPFDQARNVAAITTKQVVKDSFPVLMVVHYADDDSWAFTCGTTNKSEDLMIVGMGEIVSLDPTLYSIADLPPGWSATRASITSEWVRSKGE